MSLEIFVVGQELGPETPIQLEGRRLEQFLGDEEETPAVQIQQLLESLTESIGKSIRQKSRLEIELSGSVELKGKGGVQWLLFNIGGESSRTSTLKVTVETTVEPADRPKDG